MQMGKSALPEVRVAFDRWQAITGLDQTSPEWGEVWQVLKDTGFLAALQQRGLFDDQDRLPGNSASAVAFQMAVIGGARLHHQLASEPQRAGLEGLSVGQCTAVAAALIVQYATLFDGLPLEPCLTQLDIELNRRVRAVLRSPRVALRWQLGKLAPHDFGHACGHSLLDLVVAEAIDNDDYAANVFVRASSDLCVQLGLAPLCTGEWLLYSSEPPL